MKKFYILLSFFILSSTVVSQTKLIAHKSHSGTTFKFNKSYKQGLFDIEDSDFGLAPIRYARYSCLDSIGILPDTTILLYNSPCASLGKNDPYFFETDTLPYDSKQLYPTRTYVQNIRNILRNSHFRNNTDSVKIIDQVIPARPAKKNSVLPLGTGNRGNGSGPFLWLILLVLASAGAGYVSWRRKEA